MGQALFDVWLYAIARVADESPTRALSRVFSISEQMAAQLVAALPRVVTHDATEERASRIVNALTGIGGRCAAVAKPLRPAPVMMIGALSDHADQQPGAHAAPHHKQDTLTLGTQQPQAQMAKIWAEPAAARSIAPTAVTAIEGVRPAVEPAPGSQQTLREADPKVRAAQMRAAIKPPIWSADELPSMTVAPVGGMSDVEAELVQTQFAANAVLDPQVQVPFAPKRDVVAAPFDAIDVLDPHGDSPLALTRNVAEWNQALVSHRPPAVSVRAPHALALAAASSIDSRLALPAADASAQDPIGMRSPSQRAGAPQRLGRRSSAPPPRLDPKLPLNPVMALLNIHKQAQRSSWRSALHGHPVAGFLVVLGGTSAIFLLLYAVYRATHAVQ